MCICVYVSRECHPHVSSVAAAQVLSKFCSRPSWYSYQAPVIIQPRLLCAPERKVSHLPPLSLQSIRLQLNLVAEPKLAAEDPTDPQPPWALQRQTHSWDRLLRASILQLSKTASPPASKTLILPIAEGVVYCAWLTYLLLHHPPTNNYNNNHHSQQPVLSSQPRCRKGAGTAPYGPLAKGSRASIKCLTGNSFRERCTGDQGVLRRYNTGSLASSRHEIG